MPNNGTGQPLTLRCGKCKRGRDWRRVGDRTGLNLATTGRARPLAKAQQGRGGARVLMYRVEYVCRDCGHVGWTRHDSVLRLPRIDREETKR